MSLSKVENEEMTEFERLSLGFPHACLEIENAPVDPDLVPRPGRVKDWRLNYINSFERNRIDRHNEEAWRALGYGHPPVDQPLSPSSSKNDVHDPQDSRDNDGSDNSYFKKGWPMPMPRRCEPHRNTPNDTYTANISENTAGHPFKNYGSAYQPRSKHSVSPSTLPRTIDPFAPATPEQVSSFTHMSGALPVDSGIDSFAPATPEHVSSSTHMSGALPVDSGLEQLSDISVRTDMNDVLASGRSSEAYSPVASPAPDEETAQKLSIAHMIGCNEEHVEERLKDQEDMLLEYKLSKFEHTQIDTDAIRYSLALELMGWAADLHASCPCLKDLLMMSKLDFYRIFSRMFIAKDGFLDLEKFQVTELGHFGITRKDKIAHDLPSLSPCDAASASDDHDYSLFQDSDDDGEDN